MSSGGEANNELGIAYRDISNSGKRIPFNNQFESQNTWSQKYISERLVGMGLAIILIIVCTVWVIETPELIRYGFSGGAIFLFVLVGVANIYKRIQLKKIRRQQVEEFNKYKNIG
jgi:hypothetical protein